MASLGKQFNDFDEIFSNEIEETDNLLLNHDPLNTNELNRMAIKTLLKNNTIITNDVQLTGSTADGFLTTPTVIWNFDSTVDTAVNGTYAGTKIGTYDLTLRAQKLTQSAGILGVMNYNTIIYGGYLNNTSADFNFSDTFALGMKIFMADWSPTGACSIISNGNDSTQGCMLYLNSLGILTWYEDANVPIFSTDVSGLDVSKFHDIEVWRTATTVYLFIDEVCVASGARGTITAKQLFQISGVNGANSLMPVGTIYDEVWIDLVNTHTADTLRNVSARSAKKFAMKDKANNVSVFPIPTLASGVYTPILTNGDNVAASTAYPANWIRIGDIVYVCGSMNVDPTSASTLTAITISFPIYSNITAITDGSGVANNYLSPGGYMEAVAATDNMVCVMYPAGTGNVPWMYSFSYTVK